MTVTISDWFIIAATLLGPIVAVQLTRWLDDIRSKKDRKFAIFTALMATRAYNTSYGHVEALNRIDVEFSEKKDKKVIDSWKAYHDHLSSRINSQDLWNEKCISLFSDLLYEMSENLGYSFDKTYIKNMAYSPIRHGILENEQDKLRQALISVLEDGKSIPISITNFPTAESSVPSNVPIKQEH